MSDLTVMITAAGNVFMPGTTACLRNNGERRIRLVGADMSDDSTISQMTDAHYAVPAAADPDYTDVLLEICKRESVDVLLPVMSAELEALADNKRRFEEAGIKVSVSSKDAVSIANSKAALFDYMSGNGIPCANYINANSISELKYAVSELGYPDRKVCVKAPAASGSRGFRILDSSGKNLDSFLHEKPDSSKTSFDDFLKYFDDTVFPQLMVMEYLPGTEYTVDLLAEKGRVLYCCCRKSLSMSNSIMLDGITVENKEVYSLCRAVVEALGLDGNIGFDLKEREEGSPFIMECNPRITAGIALFNEAGVNLPYLCVKKLLGEKLPDVHMKTGVRMKRRYLEMYA